MQYCVHACVLRAVRVGVLVAERVHLCVQEPEPQTWRKSPQGFEAEVENLLMQVAPTADCDRAVQQLARFVQQRLQPSQKRVTGLARKVRTPRTGLGQTACTRLRRFMRSRCTVSAASIALGIALAIRTRSASFSLWISFPT